MFIVERLQEEGATVEICGKVSCVIILPELHLNFEHKDSHPKGMLVNRPKDDIQ